MKLHVQPETFHINNNKLITGVLYFEFEDKFFPANKWSDFVIIILGWWINELLELEKKGKGTFNFMEGPYEIEILLEGIPQICRLKFTRRSVNNPHILLDAEISFTKLVRLVVEVTKASLEKAKILDPINKDVVLLEELEKKLSLLSDKLEYTEE